MASSPEHYNLFGTKGFVIVVAVVVVVAVAVVVAVVVVVITRTCDWL